MAFGMREQGICLPQVLEKTISDTTRYFQNDSLFTPTILIGECCVHGLRLKPSLFQLEQRTIRVY